MEMKMWTVAKHVLYIPAPAECIFSKAGFIVNKTKNSMFPKNVDTLVFLSHNLKRIEQ